MKRKCFESGRFKEHLLYAVRSSLVVISSSSPQIDNDSGKQLDVLRNYLGTVARNINGSGRSAGAGATSRGL
jgi:hypothetical protein